MAKSIRYFLFAFFLAANLALILAFYSGKSGAASWTFFDVGQGDAILLASGQSQLLLDGGPGAELADKVGRAMPLWDRKIEIVAVTHPQSDHLRGLVDIIESFEVGAVYLSFDEYDSNLFRDFIAAAEAAGIPIVRAAAGQKIALGEFDIEVIWPDGEESGRKNDNYGYIVMIAEAGVKVLLFTGDIEKGPEAALVGSAREKLDADILKVAHHGSETSSGEDFLRAVSPRYAVISVGAGNSYGHPSAAVLDRLKGTAVLRTDMAGDIVFTQKDGSISVSCEKGCGG